MNSLDGGSLEFMHTVRLMVSKYKTACKQRINNFKRQNDYKPSMAHVRYCQNFVPEWFDAYWTQTNQLINRQGSKF